jgi:hypothetical protein
MKQPDFTKIFFDYFGGRPRKVRYELRFPPYFLHDLAFLNSLVHDASLFPRDVVLRGEKLTIPIERDCWEIPKAQGNELHIAKAKLVLQTVQDLRWVFEGIDKADPDQELSIDGLCINESYRSHTADRFDFTIIGHGWQLEFTLKQFDFIVKLQDVELPYLFSQKRGSEQGVPPDRLRSR